MKDKCSHIFWVAVGSEGKNPFKKVSFGNVRVLWEHIGYNGPEQLPLGPSSTPAHGNTCLGCMEAVPISHLCLWPCHLDVCFFLDGPCGHMLHLFSSLCPSPSKEFQTFHHSIVSGPAPSPFCFSSWIVPGPGFSLSISGAVTVKSPSSAHYGQTHPSMRSWLALG